MAYMRLALELSALLIGAGPWLQQWRGKVQERVTGGQERE